MDSLLSEFMSGGDGGDCSGAYRKSQSSCENQLLMVKEHAKRGSLSQAGFSYAQAVSSPPSKAPPQRGWEALYGRNGLTPVYGNKIGERKLVLDFRFVLIGFIKWLDYNNSNGAQCTKISRLLV